MAEEDKGTVPSFLPDMEAPIVAPPEPEAEEEPPVEEAATAKETAAPKANGKPKAKQ